MKTLLNSIEQYWTRRADSYSKYNGSENEESWMSVIEEQLPAGKRLKILDIGAGPGFFAIALAKRDHSVTAVDYTQAMLEKARENAGALGGKIDFQRMDAHALDFPDAHFDAIVTRNLTWNLERPQDAYRDWFRVLKKDGVMLNFDAGWYSYLFDAQKEADYLRDRKTVAEQELFDFESYSECSLMEDISRRLVLSRCPRPQTDVHMLKNAGFAQVTADTEIWRRTWSETERANCSSTPLFLLRAQK